ncbi:MAG: 2-phospho-L-lactate guanylyltransferase [Acidimicrobiales bacterium]
MTATAGSGAAESTSPPTLGVRAVLVPVKSFAAAKERLNAALGDDERRALVRAMAERVLMAASPLAVAVVCDDAEVADWARSKGALVVWEPGRGLNGAVEAGVLRLGELGVQTVTVAHADLPLAVGIGLLEPFEGVTLVPDRQDNGTNLIRLPVGCGFRFSYGPGSFGRHLEECARLGLAVSVVRRDELAFDVDWPSDLPVP